MIDIFSEMDRLIEEAPFGGEAEPTKPPSKDLGYRSGFGSEYRKEWARPTDSTWAALFAKVKERISNGAIIALIGNRGTGKTQLAAEVARDLFRFTTTYQTAMEIFLQIRASYKSEKGETELEIVNRLASVPLLIIDEIHVRNNSQWENDLLTTIIDKRYSSRLATMILGNIEADDIGDHLSPSVISRMSQTGGHIEMKGKSWRNQL